MPKKIVNGKMPKKEKRKKIYEIFAVEKEIYKDAAITFLGVVGVSGDVGDVGDTGGVVCSDGKIVVEDGEIVVDDVDVGRVACGVVTDVDSV